MKHTDSLSNAANQGIDLDPIVTCTGCGEKLALSETESTLVPHADTYSATNYHCPICAAVCDSDDSTSQS